jgi:glycosyltransferase involved in cell wall biosynthesis
MISFIIPTLNEEKVLEKLLKNLKEITSFDYEIIVSDGKSTDRTVAIAKSFGAKVVENLSGQRQTIGQGRNEGAKVARGDFLVFLDADVYIPNIETFFARALGHFKNNPKLLGLSGWVRVFPEMETWADFFGYVILSDCAFYISNNILHIGSTCGEFQMMTTGIFKQLGGYREDLITVEDKDLFYRISKHGRTLTDPKLLLYHTGRRPRAIGWPKLLWIWFSNSLHFSVYDRAHAKEWKEIR